MAGGLSSLGVIASSSASTGTIYGCVNTGGSRTIDRVSMNPTPCASGYVKIQWQGSIGAVSSPSPSPSTTTPSPSPSATSPSPSPSSSQTGTACITSANNGSCQYGSADYVINNVWNPITGYAQTLTAFGLGDWSVSASCSGSCPAGNTAVVSYPASQDTVTRGDNTPVPLASYSKISGAFTDSGVTNPGDYEWAFDIWAGTTTTASNYSQEIMIWTDNHGQRPAGSDLGPVTIGGVSYELWSVAGQGAVGNPVTLVLSQGEASGTVDVLAALRWLESNGYMPPNAGINQFNYGIEICNTGGADETFGVSAYTLTTA